MRQVTRKGLITVAAATGVLAVAGGQAQADSGAIGSASGSPGALSGNTVQIPVDVPVNVCGNTVNVVGALNPAMGNACTTGGTGTAPRPGGDGAPGGARAHSGSTGSPGIASGNDVEIPVDVPVNVCGNGVNVGGLGNPVHGNGCDHPAAPHHPASPGHPGTPQHPGHPQPPGDGPGHPGGPQHPGHPGGHHPDHPGHPADPGHPGHPGQPHDPGAPGTPGGTGPAGGGSGNGVGGGGTGSVNTSNTSNTSNTASTASTVSVRPTGVTPGPGGSRLASTGSPLPAAGTLAFGAGAVLGGALLYRRSRAGA